ncbi:hypothetical protein FGO68_gene13751 [Halteria grandinella]|uniref:Uncharacterized protein n=1 Tax=Halteria grandinella TaxID=5974 RepID=A0A8J8STW3_HALGN|nr:hypothetical protein FGO68_gene13751 [Halteria grandinella]
MAYSKMFETHNKTTSNTGVSQFLTVSQYSNTGMLQFNKHTASTKPVMKQIENIEEEKDGGTPGFRRRAIAKTQIVNQQELSSPQDFQQNPSKATDDN